MLTDKGKRRSKFPAFAEAVEAGRAAQDALVAEMERKNWVAAGAEENKVSGMPLESGKEGPEGKGIEAGRPSGRDVNVGITGKPAGDGLKASGRVPFKYDEKEGFLAQISRSGRKPEDDAAREEHLKRVARVNAFGDFVKYLAGGYVPVGKRGESQAVLPAFNDVDKVRGIYEGRKQLDADKVAGGKPVRFQLGKVPPPRDLPPRQDSGFKDAQVGETQKQEGKEEASLSGKGDKKEEKKNGFWDSYAGDVLERMGAGAIDTNASLNSLLDKMYSWTLRPWVGLVAEDDGSDTWLKKQAEWGYSKANELRNRAIRNGGKNFIDLWKEGDYTGSIGDVFLQVAESVPEVALTVLGSAGAASKAASLAEQGINAANIAMGGRLAGKGLAGTIANGMNTAQRVNVANAVVSGGTSGAKKYDDLDRMPETKDMPEFTKILNSTATGVFEGASEFLGDVPVGRWLYDVYSKKGKKAVEKVVHDGVKEWMQGQFKKNGVLVAPVKEGVEGVASQVAENVNDYLTGVTDEWNPMAGTPEAFVYAVGGKALFSMKEIPHLAVRKFERQRAKSEYRKSKEALLCAFPDTNTDAFEKSIAAMSGTEREAMMAGLQRSPDFDDEGKALVVDFIKKFDTYRVDRSPEAGGEENSSGVPERKVNKKSVGVVTANDVEGIQLYLLDQNGGRYVDEDGTRKAVPQKELREVVEESVEDHAAGVLKDVPVSEAGEVDAAQSERNGVMPSEQQPLIPQTKDGHPDYNAMLESDPALFASEWEKRRTPEDARLQLERVSRSLGKQIEALKKSSERLVDFNKMAEVYDEMAALGAQKERIDKVVKERYVSKVEGYRDAVGAGVSGNQGRTFRVQPAPVLPNYEWWMKQRRNILRTGKIPRRRGISR